MCNRQLYLKSIPPYRFLSLFNDQTRGPPVLSEKITCHRAGEFLLTDDVASDQVS